MDTRSKRILATAALVLIGILIITIVGYQLILSGTHTSGSAESTIGDQVSQSITNPLDPDKVPVEGKDYKISDKHYFENKTWMVATIESTKENGADPATIVMKLENGAYVMALGPGTSFPPEVTTGLPDSVYKYLNEQGVIPDEQTDAVGSGGEGD